ncbi:LamG-like jellyroll fold domain-containing protein [Oryzobacter terrae]|uniref:LamG-like jellyroll fold domain-containing protein n=1 Tax=Oryzobacter terrae TaxID=1620385 RepID=UPI0036719E4A
MAGGATLVLAASALVAVGPPAAVAAPGPVVQPTATAVTADRLPTVQINGVVWSQAIVGNTVYAGGSFANARPAGAAPGTNLTTRNNLLAYDLTTGNLITSFVPNLNGQVLSVAASPDGSRIYVAGDFTSANGEARRRVAAYSTATGALLPWNPSGPNSQARAVIATNDSVYVGGGFAGLGNGTLRNNLVAYRASDGAVLPWNPSANAAVWAIAVSGDGAAVFAGGQFQTVGGTSAYGVAKINATTGALDTTWRPSVRNAGPDAGIGSLRVQGNFVYGTSWHFGPGGNLEGTFKSPVDSNTDATDVEWVTDCHGDTYSSYMANGVVYVAGHAHYCGNMGGGFPQYSQWKFQHAQAWTDTVNPAASEILNDVHGYPNWHLGTPPAGVEPGPSLVNWLPDMSMGSYTGQYQAGWNVTGNSSYVVFGGEFPSVNGVGQQGLVRFAVRPIAPAREGPRFVGGAIVPRLVPASATAVRVSWPAGFDRDSRVLTYRVTRNGSTVHTTTAASNWWTLPTLGFVDSGLPNGTHSYQLVVSDSDGNQVFGNSASVSVPASAPGTNTYATSVRNSGARIYWPMNESSGTTVNDRAASSSSGPLVGVTDGRADTGVTWGQSGAIVNGDSAAALTDNDWSRVFAGNCALTAGCQWGTETAPDTFTAQLWIRTSGGLATNKRGGRLLGFGDLQNGNSGHRDRHIYMDGSGRIFFGVRAQNNQVRTVNSAAAYNNNQWHQVTATMSSAGMRLYVDGVLVGSRADTTAGESYLGYWRLGGDNLGGWPSTPPTRNFIGSVDEIAIYPSALTAAQIQAQYVLGSTGVGGGGNQAPSASFTTSTSGLTASVNASASSDPDGSITGYAWNFGDGSTGSGVTASRTYAAAGTYTVTLTVTDNDGATATTTRSVTVSTPPPAGVLASDAFSRTVGAGGWGSADVGGAWTHTSAGSFSVSGGVGNLSMAAGSGPSAYLNGVSAQDVDLLAAVRFDKPATTTIYTSMVARRIGTSDYRVKIRPGVSSTSLDLVRTISGAETVLASQVVPGFVMTAADTINLRLQAVGNGTTTVRAKIWLNGASEPAGWSLTAADTTAALQAPGAVGFYSYMGGAATNGPVTLQVQNFAATTP